MIPLFYSASMHLVCVHHSHSLLLSSDAHVMYWISKTDWRQSLGKFWEGLQKSHHFNFLCWRNKNHWFSFIRSGWCSQSVVSCKIMKIELWITSAAKIWHFCCTEQSKEMRKGPTKPKDGKGVWREENIEMTGLCMAAAGDAKEQSWWRKDRPFENM